MSVIWGDVVPLGFELFQLCPAPTRSCRPGQNGVTGSLEVVSGLYEFPRTDHLVCLLSDARV